MATLTLVVLNAALAAALVTGLAATMIVPLRAGRTGEVRELPWQLDGRPEPGV
jgi:hypothetical protein